MSGFAVNTQLFLRFILRVESGRVTGSGGEGEDVSEIGIQFKNSMVGDAAVSIQYFVSRLLCANGLIVPAGKSQARVFHSGKRQNFVKRLEKSFREVERKIGSTGTAVKNLMAIDFDPESLVRTKMAPKVFDIIPGSRSRIMQEHRIPKGCQRLIWPLCHDRTNHLKKGPTLMSDAQYKIFISSVQKEFTEERSALKNYAMNDPLLKLFISDVCLFEDLPARDQRADEAYLGEVDQCHLYVGLFGNGCGYEDPDGLSPTEREFDRATANGKTRIVFVKGDEDNARHPKMARLIQKAVSQLIRRRFNSISDLNAAFYAAMVEHLKNSGDLRTLPFDASSCPRATLADLPRENIEAFLATAKRERNYPLPLNTVREKALAHLNLLDSGQWETSSPENKA